MSFIEGLKFGDDGLIPAIVQDSENGDVLMMGFMDKIAVERTFKDRMVCFWNKSRHKYWVKGETSGHFQLVTEMFVDCDRDCLLIKVNQIGATCHEGYRSCFYSKVEPTGNLEVIAERLVDPKDVYGQ